MHGGHPHPWWTAVIILDEKCSLIIGTVGIVDDKYRMIIATHGIAST
jgi:hypothetical protein